MKNSTPPAHNAVTLLALTALLYTGGIQAASAADTERETHSELHCGPAILRATTTRLILDDGTPSQVLKQTLTLQTAEGKILNLPLDGKPQRKTLAQRRFVLDAALTSWACLNQGKTPPYLLLSYTCSFGEERGNCNSPHKEWNRLFTTSGQHLTAGLQRHDKREDAVYQQQGLEQAMRDGIALTGLER